MSDYDDTRYDDETGERRRRPKHSRPKWSDWLGGACPVPNRRRRAPSSRWELEDDSGLFGPDRDAWPEWR